MKAVSFTRCAKCAAIRHVSDMRDNPTDAGYICMKQVNCRHQPKREKRYNKALQPDQSLLSRLLHAKKPRQHALAAEERR